MKEISFDYKGVTLSAKDGSAFCYKNGKKEWQMIDVFKKSNPSKKILIKFYKFNRELQTLFEV